jgi:hypothetical protein
MRIKRLFKLLIFLFLSLIGIVVLIPLPNLVINSIAIRLQNPDICTLAIFPPYFLSEYNYGSNGFLPKNRTLSRKEFVSTCTYTAVGAKGKIDECMKLSDWNPESVMVSERIGCFEILKNIYSKSNKCNLFVSGELIAYKYDCLSDEAYNLNNPWICFDIPIDFKTEWPSNKRVDCVIRIALKDKSSSACNIFDNQVEKDECKSIYNKSIIIPIKPGYLY